MKVKYQPVRINNNHPYNWLTSLKSPSLFYTRRFMTDNAGVASQVNLPSVLLVIKACSLPSKKFSSLLLKELSKSRCK